VGKLVTLRGDDSSSSGEKAAEEFQIVTWSRSSGDNKGQWKYREGCHEGLWGACCWKISRLLPSPKGHGSQHPKPKSSNTGSCKGKGSDVGG
jgi:hypothetical protein